MARGNAWKGMAIAVLVAAAGAAGGGHLDQHQVVGDIEIFYGMTSAADVRALPAAERAMHGGVPSGKGQHHLMVTLFDRKSKQRIADAEVWASVGEIGLATTRKKLEPMASGPMSYGNYFRMGAPARYRILLEIRRPGASVPVKTEFEYLHPSR